VPPTIKTYRKTPPLSSEGSTPRLLNIGTRELFSHQITRRLNYISNRAAHAICKGHPEYETETDYVTGSDDAWKAPEALLERPAPYFAP